ncbi:MAG TPA: hypothetical protein VNQ53_11830, partial [Nocardioides sp.]|nr:hypothetical protein [Nocardioides sp.]
MNENNPLVTELMARAGGASATEAVAAAQGGTRGLGDLPPRTTLVVAASVVAVAAIAATSWGLARHDGGESAAPKAPESSEITFGPNEPAGPSTSLPTLSTLPTFPEASTPGLNSPDAFSTPSYPAATTPSYPSYTTPTYSYPTSTTPYSPYTTPSASPTSSMSTRPTSSPTTTPGRVTPIAPRATPISRCGTYGSVRVENTVGVRYELVAGNGRQGRWVVRATARKGHTIATGATTRWSGNLGKYYRCPWIKNVSVEADESATDQWLVRV